MEKLVPEPFIKTQIEHIYGSTVWNVVQFDFLLCPSGGLQKHIKANIAWKVSKYGVISGPYFPVLSSNTGKYGPEITPYLDTFHAV